MKNTFNNRISILAALGIICASASTSVQAQGPIKILNDAQVMGENYLPDFSFAGYNHGVGEIPVFDGQVIDVTKFGVIADDVIDDSAGLLKALDAAHKVAGPVVVQLPKGRVILSEVLKIQRSNIVLRGSGAGPAGTNLYIPRPLQMVETGDHFDEIRRYLKKYDKRQREKDKNIDVLFSEYSWTGGFIWVQKEGTRAASYLESEDPKIIVLANVTNGDVGTQIVSVDKGSELSVGDVVELQWSNRRGEKGPLIREMYGDTDVKIGSRHWTNKDRPLVRQKTEILSVEGDQVVISDPLLHNISADLPAQFAKWDHITDVGIEDLHISFPDSPAFGHHMERGYNAIYLTSVFNGWVRDVSVHNGDTGILSYNSANVTISNIETTGKRRAHYSVHAGNVHNMVVKNLTVNNPSVHSLSLNTQSTKCVFQNAIVNETAVLDQHAGANHQNLFDNITVKVAADRDENGPFYPIWDGSGAGYWQPGHGRFNTTWNLRVNVQSGATRSERVMLRGIAEGPDARLVGISGNREFDVDYRPSPYIERLNVPMTDVPSLYDYQLRKRLTP
ncbi:right-handed parallel beta-helix repeat-containing protein [Litorimonas cladophorae]|nr:right-handed parallel beta-helix repeat-containing protein [Litorimonas cladophorae]